MSWNPEVLDVLLMVFGGEQEGKSILGQKGRKEKHLLNYWLPD